METIDREIKRLAHLRRQIAEGEKDLTNKSVRYAKLEEKIVKRLVALKIPVVRCSDQLWIPTEHRTLQIVACDDVRTV